MKKAFEFLEKLLCHDEKIVIGVSAGPDSMCLLHVLISLKNKYNLELICAHVNHGLRKESEKEAKFLKKYCEENDVVFEYMKISSYKNNKFSEEEARRKRYNFFDSVIEKYNASYLLTAHHGDDLIETILMRIIRGSNLKGYFGIPEISCNYKYKIVRPLLNVNKQEILKYLSDNNIEYFLDKSNESETYTRNRIRKHMLPLLKKEDSNVHLKFLKFSKELEKYNNYIEKIIKEKIDKIYYDNKIDINYINKEDGFLQERIIEYIIRDIQKREIFNINDKGLEGILKLLKNNKNNQIDLQDGFIARRSYNYLYIEKNKNIDNYKYKLTNDLTILNKYNFKIMNVSNDKSNFVIRIDSEEVCMPLYIRNRKEGDKIRIKNLLGTKKIKDVFIDNKLDLKKRETYPLLVDANDTIIWIPGIKKSIFDKEINEKYDIIIKYTEEKDEQ